MVSTTDPLGNTSSMIYDAAGNLDTAIDALGRAMHVVYDNVYQVMQVVDPIGGVMGLTRDAAGRVTAVTDANGNTTSYQFDSRDRLTAEIYPDGSRLTYTWDANGNLISRSDPRGYLTTYKYDTVNQLLQITLPDGAAVTLSYDQNGNIVQRQDGSGTYQFVYNVMDRPTQIIQNGAVYKIAYDPDGRRLSLTFPDLRVTSMAYDAAGRPASVTTPDQGTTAFTYDGSGRRNGVSFDNGASALAQYDLNSRLVRLVHQGSSGNNLTPDFRMAYDAVGNMLTVDDGASRMWSYSYDNLNRLIQAVDQQGSITSSWTYDGLGNRLTATVAGVTTDYSYNNLNQLIKMGDTTLFWDGNGNLAQKVAPDGVSTYRFDSRDRLVEIGLPTTHKVVYGYDQQGRMVTRQDVVGTTSFEWNGWLLERETDPAGHITRYFYNGSEMVGFARDDQHYRVHSDWLSSVRSVTDAAGNTVFSAAYGPWGEQTVTDNVPSGGLAMRWVGGLGVRWDGGVNLYSMRRRFYDSSFGSFISRDQFHESGSLYDYSADNPLSFVDPSGLSIIIASGSTDLQNTPGVSIGFLTLLSKATGGQQFKLETDKTTGQTIVVNDGPWITQSDARFKVAFDLVKGLICGENKDKPVSLHITNLYPPTTTDGYIGPSAPQDIYMNSFNQLIFQASGQTQYANPVAYGLLVHAIAEELLKVSPGGGTYSIDHQKAVDDYENKAIAPSGLKRVSYSQLLYQTVLGVIGVFAVPEASGGKRVQWSIRSM